MEFKSVKQIISPLIRNGHRWQYISINGTEQKPKYYLSNIQWILLTISLLVLSKLTSGITNDIIGYIMGAFSISVSLFMSLLVSIFDKFENTDFTKTEKDSSQVTRLIQKKNFFKKFISITSYLVVLSILVVFLAGLSYVFKLSDYNISLDTFTLEYQKINIKLTLTNTLIIIYRATLNYFILNYLFLTLFVTGSAFEYYMSELNNRKIN